MEALHGTPGTSPKREGITLPPNPFLSPMWNAVMMDSDLAASGTMR